MSSRIWWSSPRCLFCVCRQSQQKSVRRQAWRHWVRVCVSCARIKRQGLGVALAVIVWGLCVVAFGFLPDPLWLGVLFLAGAGAADMVSVILQGIVVQSTTPDELRGRISSVTAMFSIGGPMLGSFESCLIAGLFTPMFSVVSGGGACILSALLILVLVAGLANVKVQRAA